jgi:hypothetical protein
VTLVVHAFGAYASYSRDQWRWRDADYTVRNVVKAIKGQPFRGYSEIPGVDGVVRRVDQGSQTAAVETVGAWAASRLGQLNGGPFALVPVPSSSQTEFVKNTAPYLIAQELHRRKRAVTTLGRWLRFKEPMAPSHAGGGRNQTTIRDNLAIANFDSTRPIILIDDVLTSGAHIKACAEALREEGAAVELVIVAGRTVWQQHPTPLNVSPEDLESLEGFDIL